MTIINQIKALLNHFCIVSPVSYLRLTHQRGFYSITPFGKLQFRAIDMRIVNYL